MLNNKIIRIALVVLLILLIPFVAMQFNDEIDWNLFDFVVAGLLLFGTGLAYELVSRKGGSVAYRVAVCIALAAMLLLVWINLAVGIIGSENNPANLLYAGVIALGIIGALIVRFRAHGMVRVLAVMAIVQLLVPVIALIVWSPAVTSWSPGLVGVFILNAFFAVLFIGSALLFRRVTLID